MNITTDRWQNLGENSRKSSFVFGICYFRLSLHPSLFMISRKGITIPVYLRDRVDNNKRNNIRNNTLYFFLKMEIPFSSLHLPIEGVRTNPLPNKVYLD